MVRSLLRRLLTPPLAVITALIILFEDYLWVHLAAFLSWLARHALVAAIERAARRLPPWGALLAFLVPLTTLLPVKIAAVWLIGTGHYLSGLVVLVIGKTVGTALSARLFTLVHPQLMSFPWFAASYAWVVAFKARVLGYVRSLPAWRAAVEIVRSIKAAVRSFAATLAQPR